MLLSLLIRIIWVILHQSWELCVDFLSFGFGFGETLKLKPRVWRFTKKDGFSCHFCLNNFDFLKFLRWGSIVLGLFAWSSTFQFRDPPWKSQAWRVFEESFTKFRICYFLWRKGFHIVLLALLPLFPWQLVMEAWRSRISCFPLAALCGKKGTLHSIYVLCNGVDFFLAWQLCIYFIGLFLLHCYSSCSWKFLVKKKNTFFILNHFESLQKVVSPSNSKIIFLTLTIYLNLDHYFFTWEGPLNFTLSQPYILKPQHLPPHILPHMPTQTPPYHPLHPLRHHVPPHPPYHYGAHHKRLQFSSTNWPSLETSHTQNFMG